MTKPSFHHSYPVWKVKVKISVATFGLFDKLLWLVCHAMWLHCDTCDVYSITLKLMGLRHRLHLTSALYSRLWQGNWPNWGCYHTWQIVQHSKLPDVLPVFYSMCLFFLLQFMNISDFLFHSLHWKCWAAI